MSKDTQSNTRTGAFRVLAGETLTDKEGLLVVMTHDTQVPEVILPATANDLAVYLLTEGAADAALVTVEPLENGKNVRVRLDGTCNPGDQLVLAAVDGTHDGMVTSLPSAAGTYRVIGVAEEAGVDGQLVLCRPCMLSNVTVLAE